MKIFFLNIFFFFNFLFSYAPENHFRDYQNCSYFVETGTYLGDSVQLAIDAGFEKIFSIELSNNLYRNCKKRFRNFNNVYLYCGDSSAELQNILNQIDKRAVFWLDAHYSSGNTAKGKDFSPIIKELKAISKHPIKNHTILIDDVRDFGTKWMDFVTLDEIVSLIKSINPNYEINFIDCGFKCDVLEAKAP